MNACAEVTKLRLESAACTFLACPSLCLLEGKKSLLGFSSQDYQHKHVQPGHLVKKECGGREEGERMLRQALLTSGKPSKKGKINFNL